MKEGQLRLGFLDLIVRVLPLSYSQLAAIFGRPNERPQHARPCLARLGPASRPWDFIARSRAFCFAIVIVTVTITAGSGAGEYPHPSGGLAGSAHRKGHLQR